MAYTTYDGHFIDYGEEDEKENYDSYPEPDECNKCGAWVDYPDDHATDCPRFKEQPIPF